MFWYCAQRAIDNRPFVASADQADMDTDSIGLVCDPLAQSDLFRVTGLK